jgi:hypothetical protein
MKVQKTTTATITIEGAAGLDPIRVFLEDIRPQRGRLTITCFSRAWTAAWGAMGSRSLAQFVEDCDVGYLAEYLADDMPEKIFDPDAVKTHAKRTLIEARRARMLSKLDARRLYGEISNELIGPDPWERSVLLHEIYGDERWNQLPEKANPDYVYLTRIIRAVKEGLAAQRLADQDALEHEEAGGDDTLAVAPVA